MVSFGKLRTGWLTMTLNFVTRSLSKGESDGFFTMTE